MSFTDLASGPTQSFSTKSLVNTQLALYTLSIRDPNDPSKVVYGYTFPLTPGSVSKEFTAMSAIYDVQGQLSVDPTGVHRIVDNYGNSPPTFLIEGTTGWQYHSADGYLYTGLQSISLIQNILNQYALLNQQQQANNQAKPYLLEYYDYFSGEFWQVVPYGRQTVRITRERPLVFDYSFRLAAVVSLAAPIPQPQDPILTAFSTPAPQAQSTLTQQVSGATTNYTPTGLPPPGPGTGGLY